VGSVTRASVCRSRTTRRLAVMGKSMGTNDISHEASRDPRDWAEEAGVEPTEDANAPSNGFEARAPHRERYSSGVEHAAVSATVEEALRPPRCLPLQLQLDHCQHIRSPVFSA
jgi:hypothetical protein